MHNFRVIIINPAGCASWVCCVPYLCSSSFSVSSFFSSLASCRFRRMFSDSFSAWLAFACSRRICSAAVQFDSGHTRLLLTLTRYDMFYFLFLCIACDSSPLDSGRFMDTPPHLARSRPANRPWYSMDQWKLNLVVFFIGVDMTYRFRWEWYPLFILILEGLTVTIFPVRVVSPDSLYTSMVCCRLACFERSWSIAGNQPTVINQLTSTD